MMQASERLMQALREIGDFAHDKSTGPAAPDALWDIRAMAYAAMEGPEDPPVQPVQEPVRWSGCEPDGRRYPAVPDAMTSADIQEHIEYVAGWNDCRAEMLKGMKP
jgi:hypothetical protein